MTKYFGKKISWMVIFSSSMISVYFPPFLALASFEIIWRLESVVVPPFHQGMIWSACISSIGRDSPVIGQIPFED